MQWESRKNPSAIFLRQALRQSFKNLLDFFLVSLEQADGLG